LESPTVTNRSDNGGPHFAHMRALHFGRRPRRDIYASDSDWAISGNWFRWSGRLRGSRSRLSPPRASRGSRTRILPGTRLLRFIWLLAYAGVLLLRWARLSTARIYSARRCRPRTPSFPRLRSRRTTRRARAPLIIRLPTRSPDAPCRSVGRAFDTTCAMPRPSEPLDPIVPIARVNRTCSPG